MATVEFRDERAAAKAVDYMHRGQIDGMTVDVEFERRAGPPPRGGPPLRRGGYAGPSRGRSRSRSRVFHLALPSQKADICASYSPPPAVVLALPQPTQTSTPLVLALEVALAAAPPGWTGRPSPSTGLARIWPACLAPSPPLRALFTRQHGERIRRSSDSRKLCSSQGGRQTRESRQRWGKGM
jgi:hypothetical protein